MDHSGNRMRALCFFVLFVAKWDASFPFTRD